MLYKHTAQVDQVGMAISFPADHCRPFTQQLPKLWRKTAPENKVRGLQMRSLCTLVLFPLFCICSLKAGAVTSNATVPDLTKGQSISSARKSLIKHGWRPRVTYLKMNEEDYEHSWSDAGVMFKAGLHEVETCTGTGVNPCIFNYQHKSGKCLRISTLGEYNPGHYEPTVDSWSFECPPPEALKKHADRDPYPSIERISERLRRSPAVHFKRWASD
jgi:hypothetical protein